MYKTIYIFLVIMLVATLTTSIIYILINYKKDSQQSQIFEELESIIIEEQQSNEYGKQEENIDLQKLYKINRDFIGWVKIEDTNISYPVMQTDSSRKDYYLRKNFYKQDSTLGTPYIAEYCNVKTSNNLIIYGHHINNYKMFGELEKYKRKDFFTNHKIITFNTIYENADYEIIAVFKTVAYTGFNYYKFYNANSKQEFDTFINKCKELSFYNIEETACYGDKLITLSTCEYSNKNGRLVVVAKKITNVLEE